MNPRYQFQNNSPYSQNPGYTQQAGANKYPTLPPTLPPTQNPQYPLQQHQYPGDNAQGRPAGYQPPAQYGNFQAGSNKNEERQLIVMKMADLDDGFNTCFLNFYKVWLWIVVVLCTIASVSILFASARHISNLSLEAVISFLLMVWNVTESIFGLKAISQKSLKKANVTCWMMTVVLIPWFAAEFHLLNLLVNYDPSVPDIMKTVLEYAIGVVAVLILIHIGLSMNGAFKVRKLLIERGVLQEKLDDIDYPFRA